MQPPRGSPSGVKRGVSLVREGDDVRRSGKSEAGACWSTVLEVRRWAAPLSGSRCVSRRHCCPEFLALEALSACYSSLYCVSYYFPPLPLNFILRHCLCVHCFFTCAKKRNKPPRLHIRAVPMQGGSLRRMAKPRFAGMAIRRRAGAHHTKHRPGFSSLHLSGAQPSWSHRLIFPRIPFLATALHMVPLLLRPSGSGQFWCASAPRALMEGLAIGRFRLAGSTFVWPCRAAL